jgi:hypothetical protein
VVVLGYSHIIGYGYGVIIYCFYHYTCVECVILEMTNSIDHGIVSN